jgi:predicted membrane GTPase involved in stress response
MRSTSCSRSRLRTDEQIEFPILYAVSREGMAKRDWKISPDNLQPLFDQIVDLDSGAARAAR